jgi:LPXTG-motif cell wall-anchored protein
MPEPKQSSSPGTEERSYTLPVLIGIAAAAIAGLAAFLLVRRRKKTD